MTDKLDSNRLAQLHSILARWDIPPVHSIEPIYHKQHVLHVISEGQTFTLKDISDAPNLVRLEFTRDVLTHVARSGLEVPVPLLSRSAQCAESFEGRYYILSKFIEADTSPTAPELQPELFKQTGHAIARLHAALATYPDTDLCRRTWRQDLAGEAPQWFSALCDTLPAEQAAVVKRVRITREGAIVRALQNLPEQLIHRDCHPGNILVQGTRVVGFIDCDHLCIAPRVFDLAYYAVHHLKWVTDDDTATARWLTNLPYLFAGYRAQQSLKPAEISALPYAMMAYHLLLAAWFLHNKYSEPIALELQALDWLDTNFDAVVAATLSI